MLKSIIYKLYQSSYFIQFEWITKDLQRFERNKKDRSQNKDKSLLGESRNYTLLKNYFRERVREYMRRREPAGRQGGRGGGGERGGWAVALGDSVRSSESDVGLIP